MLQNFRANVLKIEAKVNSEMAFSQIVVASFLTLTASLWHVNKMVLIN